MSTAKAAFEGAQDLFGKAVNGLKELKWEDVPAPVRMYIQEHPTLSAVQLAMLLVLTCPGLVVTPLLGWIGFSTIGPVAGKQARDQRNSLMTDTCLANCRTKVLSLHGIRALSERRGSSAGFRARLCLAMLWAWSTASFKGGPRLQEASRIGSRVGERASMIPCRMFTLPEKAKHIGGESEFSVIALNTESHRRSEEGG